MRISVGILSAPRPEPTLKKCSHAIAESGFPLIHHATESDSRHFLSPCEFERSPTGSLGNFQNWLQTARDLLTMDHDAILIAEDDALFCRDVHALLQRDLWPAADCGCVSLYCPAMSHYRQSSSGLHRTRIARAEPMTNRTNLVGALALVFPASVLRELVYHDSISQWGGSHMQASNPKTKPYERKAVDTWIGRTLISMGRSIWHYSPSLVQHYVPNPKIANSSLGHGMAIGNRQSRSWAGNSKRSVLEMIPANKEKFDVASSGVPEHQV